MKRFKIFLFLAALVATSHATVYYVSADGDGSDGLTWETAYKSPAAALAGIEGFNHEVWVKQGTYVSTTALDWKTTVHFYGGFVGTETEREQRDLDASLTILEGVNNRVLNTQQLSAPTTWSGFTIQKGKVSGGGAGVFMQKNSILDNCIIQDNESTNEWGGAGIYIQVGDEDSIKVVNCIVRNNIFKTNMSRTDKHGGGGICVRPDAKMAVIRNCIIEDNIADGLGTGNAVAGGVFLAAGKIENSIVRNNKVTNIKPDDGSIVYNGKAQGGGIFIMPQKTENTITVKNCTITGNESVTSTGGGISIDPLWTGAEIKSPIVVTGCFITNNSAYRNGGGIMTEGHQKLSTGDYIFENCVIANNESSTVAAGGGGAFIANIEDYAGTVSFTNCTVTNNKMMTTNYGGGGIFYQHIKSDLTNCVFWGNGSVGAIYPYHVRVKTTLTTNKLINCAFDNRFVESQVSPTGFEADLTGLVIVEQVNSGEENSKLYANFKSPTNFVGNAKTESDITSFEAADWSLVNPSALINAGKTVPSITTDIIGTVRPQEDKYDIGAYEFDPSTQTGMVNRTEDLKIYAYNGVIYIDNNADSKKIQVYNLSGNLLVSKDSKLGLNEIVLPSNQLYIVKVGSKVTKIIL